MRLLWIQVISLLCYCLSQLAIATTNDNFLVISDIHLDSTTHHVMQIEPNRGTVFNVLDMTTLEQLLAQLKTNIEQGILAKPNFIILQGDLVGYFRFFSNSARNNEAEIAAQMKKNFPSIPVFYVFGNNDALKQNYGLFVDSSRSHPNSPYEVFKSLGGWSGGFLSSGIYCKKKNKSFPCIITENTSDGYYAAYIKPGFRLLALNTVLFAKKRQFTNEQESKKHLDWLKKQLIAARNLHESLLLVMHIPPGKNVYDHSDFWHTKEQAAFLDLINTYRTNIVGLLASHTHKEELKIIQEKSGKALMGVYFTAGFSSTHGNAPSVKTFYFKQVHPHQWRLINYKTFCFYKNQSTLQMKLLYDYKNYYCSPNAKEINQCLDQVTSEKMQRYFTCGNPNYTEPMKSPDDIFLTIPGADSI